MAKTVSILQLSEELKSVINESANELKEKLILKLEESSNQLVNEIQRVAPVAQYRNDLIHLKDSFTTTKIVKRGNVSFKVWSPKKYGIVHLLEFGHFNWISGGFVQPQPFLIPSFNKISEQMVEEIKTIIKGGK